MMQWYRFSLLSICLLLSSCNVIEYVTWTGREPQSQAKDDIGLKMTLWVDHYCYKDGEPFLIRLTLENTTSETITLGGGDGAAVDIRVVIYGANSTNTISWAETDGQTEALNSIELESGETYEIEWSVLPPPDRNYEIRGVRVRYGAEFDVALTVHYPPCRGDG
jgi:hypothetical protein